MMKKSALLVLIYMYRIYTLVLIFVIFVLIIDNELKDAVILLNGIADSVVGNEDGLSAEDVDILITLPKRKLPPAKNSKHPLGNTVRDEKFKTKKTKKE